MPEIWRSVTRYKVHISFPSAFSQVQAYNDQFIIIVDVFRVFVDTGEIKYIPFSEEALQCLYVGRVYVDLQVVGTDNDFYIGIMFPANPLYFPATD